MHATMDVLFIITSLPLEPVRKLNDVQDEIVVLWVNDHAPLSASSTDGTTGRAKACRTRLHCSLESSEDKPLPIQGWESDSRES
jgi:hypothetical protein